MDSKDPSLEFLGLDINITGPRGGVKQATKNALLVGTLIKQQPEFCKEIARAKASFNPIDCLMDEMKEHNVKTAAELVAVWEGPRSAKPPPGAGQADPAPVHRRPQVTPGQGLPQFPVPAGLSLPLSDV